MYSINTAATFRHWKSERPVKVWIVTITGYHAYGNSFKSRDDAVRSIMPMLGDCGWLPVIDGMVRSSEVAGIEFFGESDNAQTPIRVIFDTEEGHQVCAISFKNFEEAENSVSDWIANREWIMCEKETIRSSTVRSFEMYDMRGDSYRN